MLTSGFPCKIRGIRISEHDDLVYNNNIKVESTRNADRVKEKRKEPLTNHTVWIYYNVLVCLGEKMHTHSNGIIIARSVDYTKNSFTGAICAKNKQI